MPAPRVSIRLGTDGKADVVKDFADIGDAGDAQSQRIARAFERDSATAEAALEKLNKTAQRLAAVSPVGGGPSNIINPITGGSYAQADGAAQASARAIASQMSAGEQAAQRLLASLDPLYAAQLRYDQALAEANTLQAQGLLSSSQYASVQTGLKRQLDDTTALYGKQGDAIGNTRIAQMELMHVVRGSVDQYAAGAPPMQIFTMHLGMLGQAAALSGESMGKFGAFMASGWGLALTVAVVALGPLVTKLFESGKASDDLVEKLKKQAQQTALNDQAHAAFAHTVEGSIATMHDLTKELDAQNRTLEDNIALKKAAIALGVANTMTNIGGTSGDLAAAVTRLHQAQHDLELAQSGRLGGDDPGVTLIAAQADVDAANQRVADLTGQLNALNTAAENGARALRSVDFPLLEQHAKELVDPIARINRQYDDMAKKAQAAAAGNDALKRSLGGTLDDIERRRQADLAAAKEDARKPGQNAGGDAIQRLQIAAYFDEANKFRGNSETSDKAVLESFFRAANENLDPEKTAWCAAFVNAVLANQGVQGTGSLAARSFLGFGKDDIASPQKGDIVILKGAAGDHVGFLDSIDAKGNVSVLAGNTGNRVAEATYAATSVLGIRRPPTPGEAAADDARAAEQWSKMLDEGMAKEQKIDLLHEGDLSLVRQIAEGHQLTLDTLDKILPRLDEWNREYERIKASQEEFRQFGDQELDTLFNPDNWKNWGDLGRQVLHDLENELIKLTLLNPLKNWLGGENNPTLSALFQGIGTIAGGLFGGGAPVGGGSGGSQGFVGPPNAAGTEYFGGGATWVGEFGKELVTLPRGSKITPAAESRRMAAANDGGIGSITIPINIDATGADPAALARTNARLDQLDAELPGRVVEAYFEAKSRNIITG